jgi:DNA replication and repair protein RecF
MSLIQFQVRDFRNIKSADINFTPALNLITGVNAAGKTSLLEAIYYLSTGNSFRAHTLEPIINRDQSSFTLAGLVKSTASGSHRIGVMRSKDKTVRKIDSEKITSQSDITRLFPVRIIHPDSHILVSGSPSWRRKFIDWGCFYMHPQYQQLISKSTRLLKQRASILRNYHPRSEKIPLLQSLDKILVPVSESIDEIRDNYLRALNQHIQSIYPLLIKDVDSFTVQYFRGWPPDADLSKRLIEETRTDIQRRRTNSGIHRCNLITSINASDAKQNASRGQQKLIALTLILAQILTHLENTDIPPILLIDDLTSELDTEHQVKLIDLLKQLNIQVIITSLTNSLPALAPEETGMFHVKHGVLNEVI